ncbi:MAG: DUF5722 domain-containing protein [Lachnospiraceae bacterium]|nr:DUF5722 domain-containing protein [Lachnospiraceae bacterium]
MRKGGFIRRSVSLMVSLLLVVTAVAAGIVTTPVSTEAKSKKSAAASGSAYTVAAAVIAGSNVTVTATGSATTDDGLLHLYAFQPYEGGNAGSAVTTGTEVANAPASATAAFTFALGKNTANSNLFKKFAVVGIKGGVLTQLSGAHYITNPEACATHTAARNYSGKKGILPAATMFNTNDLAQLGVQQATFNMNLGQMCTGGGINYTYNGKTYSFNSLQVAQYDILVPKLNKMGIEIDMVVLNDLAADTTLIHPLATDAAANGVNPHYYALNTANQAGVEKLEAIASFLGQRYSGGKYGTIDNYIIGNEVNARTDWNYMTNVDVNTFANEYEKAVRIFYNGLRSENANVQVYTSIDQQWARSSNAAWYYGSKPFLDAYNSIAKAGGDYDWHVATHPYDIPLYDPVAWSQSAHASHSQSSPYITMQNIDVLTDYLSQSSLLSPTGQVRSVLCSEVGYTSLSAGGEQTQAAAIIYGYMQAMANQHVDGFILSREQDAAEEIAQGLANGVCNLDTSHKLGWSWYQQINGAGSAAIQAEAAQVIGVSSLQSILTVR